MSFCIHFTLLSSLVVSLNRTQMTFDPRDVLPIVKTCIDFDPESYEQEAVHLDASKNLLNDTFVPFKSSLSFRNIFISLQKDLMF